MYLHCFDVLLCLFSLGQLITMAGLDRTNMPFSAKQPDSSDVYINGQSRVDTTRQMRDILEHSHLDESILSVDLQPACNGYRSGFTVKPPTDPTQQFAHDQPSVSRTGPGSKFDELYQQALRNTESILSDSGNPPDGHNTLRNLHSPVRSVDCGPSDNESQLETSAVQPLNKSVASGQNGHLLTNCNGTRDIVGKPPNSSHLQGAHQSEGERPPASRGPTDADKSIDSGGVDETEISEEYSTEEDDGEEIVASNL